MSEWVRVAAVDACPPGSLLPVTVGGRRLVIANVEGTFHALEDRCSHADLPLSDGSLEGNEVVCAHHGARFEAATGRALSLPAIRAVKTFEVDVRDGEILVRTD